MAKKKNGETQLSLDGAPARPVEAIVSGPVPATVEKLVEYSVEGEPWRCERFDLLIAELGSYFDPKHLPVFHQTFVGRERLWLIVRRLFGFKPVLPSTGYALEDLKTWDRESLREVLGIERKQLQAELDAVRGAWLTLCPKPEPKVGSVEKPKAPPVELQFSDADLLDTYDFRVRFMSVAEGAWFAERVRELEPLFKERVTKGLARGMAMTELQLRRLDEYLADSDQSRIGSADYRSNQKQKQELEKAYREQLTQIKDVAPWFTNITAKHSFKDVISDITRGMQLYYGRGDRSLIDGIFTALELQVELRQSVQAPEPRYRAGLVVALNQAKASLWDPNHRCTLPASALKKLDAGWKAAAMSVAAESGETIPDLEKDGPGGEYADLKTKAELQAEPKE